MTGRSARSGGPARGSALVRRAWRVGVVRPSADRRPDPLPNDQLPNDPRPDGPRDDPHEQQCRKLMETLRRHCPEYLPPPPLPPGKPGEPVTVERQVVERLVFVAALGAAGIDGPDGEPTAPGVVWVDGDRELFVLVTKVQVALSPGAIAVSVPVMCDQIGDAEIHVTFAVGSPDRPLGLVAATEERPRGPREVVDVWGEALIAFAWQILLDVTAGIAAHAGEDTDGAFLLPAALASTGDGLTVLPQARHSFDRAL